MSFSSPVVGCLVKKRLAKRGGTGTPGSPWLRLWCLVWKQTPLSARLVYLLWRLEPEGRDSFRHSRQTRKHKSRIPCPFLGESRFRGKRQIPDPVNIFIIFPTPVPYFSQIPNPENTLPDPVGTWRVDVDLKLINNVYELYADCARKRDTMWTLCNTGRLKKTQDGRMTKKCRARLGIHSLKRHFLSFSRPESSSCPVA